MTLEYRNARLPRPPLVSFRRRMPRVSRSLPYREGADCEPWGSNNLEVALAAIRNLLATWTSTGSRKPATLSLLKGHTDAVRCLAFAPDGALLASGSSDGTVRLWEVASGREATQLRGHVGWVVALAFTPDGLALASGGTTRPSACGTWLPAERRRRTSVEAPPRSCRWRIPQMAKRWLPVITMARSC